MRPRHLLSTSVVLGALALAACSGSSGHSAAKPPPPTPPSATCPDDACVRLNQVQVVGTHNSYHLEDPPQVLALIKSFDKTLGESIEYTHPALPVQFSREGVRQIELDVFADPRGGRYAKRRILALVKQPIDSGIPAMSRPGFKVLHAQDVDFNSNCLTFVDCLTGVRSWSRTHPGHLPIAILVEAKDDPTLDPLHMGFVVPPPLTTADFDALDAEIRSVFPPGEMITPDDVRGRHATLEQAVRSGTGWPTLAAARGKVFFLLDQAGQSKTYLTGHPGLRGRVIFTNSAPGRPDAAFVEMNDPNGKNLVRIRELVREGYLVRTRADADTVEARSNATTTRDNAIASGAQFVSTDYPAPDKAPFSPYVVTLPGDRAWRCNPVNTGPACVSSALDTPG
ncbi:MAG TPA: phosphatidylinositol-specific phospholipase C1-like protein [Acidimicrobiia bacterium]